MTATQTNAPRSTSAPATDLNDLADRIDATVTEALGASVTAFRALANESNIARARVALRDATDTVEAKQADRRDAADKLATAREEHAAALTSIEWELGSASYWASRSNKQWLHHSFPAGEPIPEDEQRSFTADERSKWITTEAAKTQEVASAAQALRKAELAKEQADDELKLAERRWTAARIELEAATGYLVALSNSLRGNGNGH